MINAARMRPQHGRYSGSRSTAPHRFDAGLRQNCHNDSDGCANGCRMQTGTRAGKAGEGRRRVRASQSDKRSANAAAARQGHSSSPRSSLHSFSLLSLSTLTSRLQ